MILSKTQRADAGRTTLGELLARNARQAGDRPSLFDAPDRPLWTDGAPRRLSWAQLDHAASAVAARMGALGLSRGAVVGIQGPNSSDTLIAILGCLRADLIPAMLPIGWRNAEVASALEAVGARAIVAATRSGPEQPLLRLLHVAADNFAIRFVCTFGHEVPDGVVPLEDCVSSPGGAAPVPSEAAGNPAEHIAVITWDCGARGFFPVARSHNECLAAAAMAGTAEGEEGGCLLSTLSPATFAGLATGLVPWLAGGGSLALHQGFDNTVFGVQIERHSVSQVVLPSLVWAAARREGVLPETCAAVTVNRRPDLAAEMPGPNVRELAALGEVVLLPLAVGGSGERCVALGAVAQAQAGIAAETAIDDRQTLAVRGSHVPQAAFPTKEDGAGLTIAADGWVSTGFPVSLAGGQLRFEGPRNDLVMIGGHGLALGTAETIYADVPGAISVNVSAVADPILGQRLQIEAMPQPGAELSAVSLIMHAEQKAVSPLAMTAEASVGERRRRSRLSGAA